MSIIRRDGIVVFKYDYCGERVPAMIPVALYEGFRDAKRLPMEHSLYRHGWLKAIMWSIGNRIGRLLR